MALADMNAPTLEETTAMVRARPVRVSIHVVDVAKLDQVIAFAGEVVKAHGGVHLLINNAGVALTESLEDLRQLLYRDSLISVPI